MNNDEVRFDPMTGEPLVQIGFDPMTGEPVYGTKGSLVPSTSVGKKRSFVWPKIAAVVVGVAALTMWVHVEFRDTRKFKGGRYLYAKS